MGIFLKYRFKKAFLMRYIMFFPICVILFLTFSFSSSGLEGKAGQIHNYINYDKNNIKSVMIHQSGFELSDPVIQIGTNEQLLLSFDDLDDQLKSYQYSIQLCNANWEPTELNYAEYINGFPRDQINDYSFSLNTTTSYIHYQLVFPTDYLQIKKSGNYIIKVFEDDEESVAFTRRFKILDRKVKIEAEIKPPMALNFKAIKQEIGFKIFLNNLYIPNPESSIKIVIQQNNGTGQVIEDIRMVRNQGNILDYYFNNKSVFYGGNEFRALNIKSLKYKTESVNLIEFQKDGYHVFLYKDQPRFQKNYIFENDINGKKLIKTEDELESSIEADYAWVHFSLQADPSLLNKSVFINGELTEGIPVDETQMYFNARNNQFEGSLLLKQGYYNYQYITKDPINFMDDLSYTEGNHFETNNEYSIFVYYREAGTYFDQLIGFEKISGP